MGSNDSPHHRSRISGSTNLCDSVACADHGASAAAKKLETLSGKWLIRAIQGHTIPYIRSDLFLRRVKHWEELPVCVHGTYLRNWMAIRHLGLHRMHRNHIHFATGFPGDASVVSGMRRNSEVAMYADVKRSMEAGVVFFQSANGVVLTDGINGRMPPWLFSKVVLLREDITLMSDGVDMTDQHLHLIPSELCHTPESAIFREQLQHDLGVLQLSPYAAPTCGLLNLHSHRLPHPHAQRQPEQVHLQKDERYPEAGEPPPAFNEVTDTASSGLDNMGHPPADAAGTPESAEYSIQVGERRPLSAFPYPPAAPTWGRPDAAEKEQSSAPAE